MWNALGFIESPYNTSPLRVLQEDVDLLVGREDEALAFCTALDASKQGVLVLSGQPGVGKTSFLNVQQYLLEKEQSLFGPKVLAARQLCPTQPADDSMLLATRALDSLCRSVLAHCAEAGVSVPSETKKISKWLNSKGGSGFELGLDIFGFGGSVGRQVELPAVSDATFESIVDVIKAITSEVVNKLNFSGAIIVLDNMENLAEEKLGDILISFRDTLFSVENVWWVLIGQAGLSSLIQTLDPRVSERLSGSGIEMKPVSLDELDKAINLRVARFHKTVKGEAPLPKLIHSKLYEASFGEMRFVFKYSNTICTRFVEAVRRDVIKQLKDEGERITRDLIENELNEIIGVELVREPILYEDCMQILKQIVQDEFDGLKLKNKEIEVLSKIGEEGKARAKDYKEFGMKTMQDFSSNYLTKMMQQKLLSREQEGRAVNYRLRGTSMLCYEFGLLEH